MWHNIGCPNYPKNKDILNKNAITRYRSIKK